jgi:hypothetical protein
METDILNELGWAVQYISVYDILTHFLCQGIFFTSDEIQDNSMKSNHKPAIMKLKAASHHA